MSAPTKSKAAGEGARTTQASNTDAVLTCGIGPAFYGKCPSHPHRDCRLVV
jgi:hypothetical protein